MKNTTRSLGEFTATGAAYASRTLLAGVALITDGTNPCDIVIHDNDSAAAGTKVFESGIAGSDRGRVVTFSNPIKCENGLYVTVTGTGASCIVYVG